MNTTVIIPNYNGMKYIASCLDSLKDSGDEGIKVLVVDDGSTDGSSELVRSSYPDVELIVHESNRGFAASVNTGIMASDTDYVLLLNNDTVVKEHFVRNLEQAIEADEKVFSVSAKMLKMDDPDIMDGAGDHYCALGWAFAYGKGKKADRFDSAGEVFSACAGAAIYRRSVLTGLGLFDERHFAYLEDVDIGYRARIAGYKNMYAPDAVVLHAGSGFSGSRYNEFKISLSSRNSTYLICKNMPLLQQILNLPFLILGFMIKIIFFIIKGYGGTYIKGIFRGISMGYDREGRAKRVRFKLRNLGSYASIQIKLWVNILRRFA